jgi:AcrR family transcriptional regulator
MQSAAALKTAPLQPDNWIRAAFARLANEGIESVRIELLARDLGVSKGSFYWHFRDREDLLTCVLDRWEADEVEWLAATDVKMRAAARWARFVEHCADLNRARLEAAVRGWAQRDEGMSTRISTRISGIDKKRTAHIASVLRDIGFTAPSAASWSELALLVYLGWLDRVTRDAEFQASGRGLGEFLSDLILAASQHSAPATT